MVEWFFQFLTQWYLWVPVAGILTFLTWQNYRKAKLLDTFSYSLLELEIPRKNDKDELAAEQLFASLHSILRDRQELRLTGGIQEHLSFEIANTSGKIRFFVRVPKHLQNFVESQIRAQYPTVQIINTETDYANIGKHSSVATAELVLNENDFLPIKTSQSYESDPLASVSAALSKLNTANEEMWVQVLMRPIDDSWKSRAARFVAKLKSGIGAKTSSGNWVWFAQIVEALWKPPESGSSSTAVQKLSARDELRSTEAEKKSQKLGYQVKIRLACLGDNNSATRSHINAVASAFKQFGSANLNSFRLRGSPSFKRDDLQQYSARFFDDNGFILNVEELASLYHLPHTGFDTPVVAETDAKPSRNQSPSKLPILTGERDHDDQISAFGLTKTDDLQQQFGMYRSDRSRHVYVIGQTGTGKSALLELLALSDVFHKRGYAIIDPHGDFAINNLRFVPPNRIKDVVYFNPADTAYPLGFNPMEVYDTSQRSNISSEIIGVLKRMFGDSWGPRLEYILRYTILALLEYPNTTMLDITRMLTDKKFREKVLAEVQDTVVLQFWRVEFASWNDRFAAEAIAPVLNKVGAFVANPIIRNIIGQPKSTFNIREIMDEGKILIVNLSKGLIGDDNAAILGALMVTKIQLAAMSRSDIPNIDDRRPFYLYVDEFQNFATDSFAVILSEARKYGLNLTVANQYVSQMSESVRNAVFGNVGSIVSMRVSAEDAPLLAKQFAPRFETNDLLQMNNRDFICSMMIKGEKMPAFPGTTLQLPPAQVDYLTQIIDHTRTNYARKHTEVETEISATITPPTKPQSKAAQTKTSLTLPKTAPALAKPTPPISPAGHITSADLSILIANAKNAAAATPQEIDPEPLRKKNASLNPEKLFPVDMPAPQAPQPKRKRTRGNRKKSTDNSDKYTFKVR